MANQNNSLMANVDSERYVSFSTSDNKTKIALYNAINQPKYKVGDMINRSIKMKDAVIVKVDMERDDGNIDEAHRSILIDENGDTYAATSNGIYNSLRNIYAIFGTLHFEQPLEVAVSQISTKRGSTLSLTIVE